MGGRSKPQPPAPPEPPPPPPTVDEVARKEEVERLKKPEAKGRASTILTSPAGVLGEEAKASGKKYLGN